MNFTEKCARRAHFLLDKRLAEFRARRREKIETRFFRRRVRRKKHSARSLCRIVRFQRTTEAQSAANPSQKSGPTAFLKVFYSLVMTGSTIGLRLVVLNR